jgi:hypothetical protein
MIHRIARALWRVPRRITALTAGLFLLPVPVSLGSPIEGHAVARAGRPDPPARTAILETVRGLPLRLEANQGQTDPQVDFIARGSRSTVFLTARGAVLMLRGSITPMDEHAPGQSRAIAVRLQLVGASARPRVVGLERLPGRVNHVRGNDPARWHTNVPTYARVRYQEIYPGIDLVYYGNDLRLEYDFVVRPGADPRSIVLAFAGAERIELSTEGDLLLHTAGEVIRHRKPVIYQDVEGTRRELAGGYVLKGTHEVGFTVGAYDGRRPLVIDPVLFHSTYLGGTDNDEGGGIVVDGDGNAYVTGRTASTDFPTTAGAVDTTLAGLTDAFVTKLDPTGAIVYSTYLGGTGGEEARGIVVDAAKNAYVIGQTTSADFPTTAGAFQTASAGLTDAFVTKLDPTGSMVYSTYLGGAGDEEARGIAVDAAGSAYVAGDTPSANFPTTAGAFQGILGGLTDVFVTKLDPAGSALVYSTYLGGAGTENDRGIAVDAAGSAFLVGDTTSANLPTTAGAFQTTLAGQTDAFVTKLDPAGSALAYSTYLGGTRADQAFSIALDALPNPNAYVAGRTSSTNLPTTAGAFQTTPAGQTDAFVAKLDPAGSTLVYSTYLGGSRDDVARGVSVDAAGSAFVVGQTASANFPIAAGALQPTLAGVQDAFVTKLNAAGSALVYSTYLGGTGAENGRGIAVDAGGSAVVTGKTTSTDFPTTAGAFDPTFNGLDEAFVAKIADFGPPATLGLAPNTATNPVGTQHCVAATVTDGAGIPVRSVTVRFSVTGAHSDAGPLKTDANGQATFCYGGTKTGNDSISAFADTNNSGVQDPSEPGGTATKTWVSGPAATLTLAPNTATMPVNTEHCVTATVRDGFGNPVTAVPVRFTVSGSVATTGLAATDGGGQAPFCYLGPSQPGQDSITAFADANGSGVQDAGEPGDAAAATWAVPGAPATLTLAPSTATNPVATQHCVAATVGDAFGSAAVGVTVQFGVSGSVAATESAVTDATGQAPFCYTGPSQPGTDAISAFADTNDNGAPDAGEPGGTAAKNWAAAGGTWGWRLAPSAAPTEAV